MNIDEIRAEHDSPGSHVQQLYRALRLVTKEVSMCRGPNKHKYIVTVHTAAVLTTPARRLFYIHKSYLAAVRHTLRLNDKKQPRLSRWYKAGRYAKVIIRRECM